MYTDQLNGGIVARYYSGNQLFVKRSQYIRIKIPFISYLKKPACTPKQDVLELTTLRYTIKLHNRSHLNLQD